MAGQHRWAPGAALTVADLVAPVEPKWPTDDPDPVMWVAPDGRVYRQGAQTRDALRPRTDHFHADRPPVPPSTVPYHVDATPDRDGRQPRPVAAATPIVPSRLVVPRQSRRHARGGARDTPVTDRQSRVGGTADD